jgi:hypothetical protein
MRLTRKELSNMNILAHDNNYGYLVNKENGQTWVKHENDKITVIVEDGPFGQVIDRYEI